MIGNIKVIGGSAHPQLAADICRCMGTELCRTTVVRFSILRDGSIADLQVIKPSGSPLLDRASQRALLAAKLPALPSQYKSEKLTVNLTFPYEGR